MSGRPVVAQYYPGTTWLHRLDPRAKIAVTVALAVALFTRQSFAALGVYAVLAVAGLIVSRVPPSWFWRAIKPVLWLVALTVIAQLLFARGEVLAEWGPFAVTREGLETAGLLSLRLVLLVIFGLLLTFTTAPIPLTDGLAWLLRPLRALHFPTEELALMVTIALRFIPTLLGEVETIMQAQRARGADFSRGGPIRRARALVPVLVPLFVLSFRRADQLALAMEARCYEPGQRRTRLHPLHAGWGDLVLCTVTVGAIVLASLI
jgi:energy-coupling factor transport system permease protein